MYFIVVTLIYGLVGMSIGKYRPELSNNFGCTTVSGNPCTQTTDYTPSTISMFDTPAKSINFFNGIGITFTNAPWWANTLVFIPFIVLITWLIIIILLHGG
jgi:hypothetical protein